MISKKTSSLNSNFIIFISITTIFLIAYLIQKNNYLKLLDYNDIINKELIYYSTLITAKKGNVTGLKRSDRIRDLASKELQMIIAEPESLIIYIDE